MTVLAGEMSVPGLTQLLMGLDQMTGTMMLQFACQHLAALQDQAVFGLVGRESLITMLALMQKFLLKQLTAQLFKFADQFQQFRL